VLAIKWDSPGGKVKVTCKDKTFEADIVLVTCSLGVLKDKADKLFLPLLPEKKRAAIAVSVFLLLNRNKLWIFRNII